MKCLYCKKEIEWFKDLEVWSHITYNFNTIPCYDGKSFIQVGTKIATATPNSVKHYYASLQSRKE
jgi:hypothetical protein